LRLVSGAPRRPLKEDQATRRMAAAVKIGGRFGWARSPDP
jgi:hypothetical protein